MAGLAVGVIVALFSKRGLSWTLKLAACAMAGFVLTASVTFLIPDTYTSNAVVRANVVARFEQQVQDTALLADVIATAHLYPNDHASAVTRMRSDLKLRRLTSQVDGSGVVQIEFTYRGDRDKAQEAIRCILDRVTGDDAAAHAALASQPFEPHSPTTLPPRTPQPMEMIDPASRPEQPTSPKRLFIALAGLAVGLLWGGLGIRRAAAGAYYPRRTNELGSVSPSVAPTNDQTGIIAGSACPFLEAKYCVSCKLAQAAEFEST